MRTRDITLRIAVRSTVKRAVLCTELLRDRRSDSQAWNEPPGDEQRWVKKEYSAWENIITGDSSEGKSYFFGRIS
jgi:hypothetical protein